MMQKISFKFDFKGLEEELYKRMSSFEKKFILELVLFLTSLTKKERSNFDKWLFKNIELINCNPEQIADYFRSNIFTKKISFDRNKKNSSIDYKKEEKILQNLLDEAIEEMGMKGKIFIKGKILRSSLNKEDIQKNTIDIYYHKCPICGEVILLEELTRDIILGEIDEEEEIVINCGHCEHEVKFKLDDIRNNKVKEIKIRKWEVKTPKLISYEEAVIENFVNPGTVFVSYDKIHWMPVDSDSSFWPENVSFATLNFE